MIKKYRHDKTLVQQVFQTMIKKKFFSMKLINHSSNRSSSFKKLLSAVFNPQTHKKNVNNFYIKFF
jgi:hypothetical protein